LRSGPFVPFPRLASRRSCQRIPFIYLYFYFHCAAPRFD
jgi:hypothetical protein